MPSQAPPAISVIVVTWNSAAYLPRCFRGLEQQTYHDFEVLVVDNASTDGGPGALIAARPRLNLRLHALPTNVGFAAANNHGARLAQGKWLALLNPDAFPEPDWLSSLVSASAAYPNSFFASRQLQANHPGLLDGEGDEYHVSGLAWRRNYSLPTYPAHAPEEVFSACGAAALYPREDFLALGGFDEDYFAYIEDVDMGFRLRMRGLRCIFVPAAVVHHVGSGTTSQGSDFAVYHGHRNMLWAYAKDMPALLAWVYLPLAIVMHLYFLLSYGLQGRARVIWRAKLDGVRGLRKALRKRSLVQSGRIVSTGALHRVMSRSLWAPLQAKWIRVRRP
jgi:GT2 family glycosyltransferase